MRKLFSNGLAVFAGVVSLPVPGTQADSAKPATAEHRNEPAKDSRLAFLRAFFAQGNCPAATLSPIFLEAADMYALDSRLRATTSVRETLSYIPGSRRHVRSGLAPAAQPLLRGNFWRQGSQKQQSFRVGFWPRGVFIRGRRHPRGGVLPGALRAIQRQGCRRDSENLQWKRRLWPQGEGCDAPDRPRGGLSKD